MCVCECLEAKEGSVALFFLLSKRDNSKQTNDKPGILVVSVERKGGKRMNVESGK